MLTNYEYYNVSFHLKRTFLFLAHNFEQIFFLLSLVWRTVWIPCNTVYQIMLLALGCSWQLQRLCGRVETKFLKTDVTNYDDSLKIESKTKYQIGILNFKRLLLLFTFLSRQCGNFCTYTLSKVEILSCRYCSQNANKLTVVS